MKFTLTRLLLQIIPTPGVVSTFCMLSEEASDSLPELIHPIEIPPGYEYTTSASYRNQTDWQRRPWDFCFCLLVVHVIALLGV